MDGIATDGPQPADNLPSQPVLNMTFIKFGRSKPGKTLIGTLCALPFAAWAQQPQQLPTVQLQAGMYNIVAQVARTDEQRQTGLMFRKIGRAHV